MIDPFPPVESVNAIAGISASAPEGVPMGRQPLGPPQYMVTGQYLGTSQMT